MINPKFKSINKLFVFTCQNGCNDPYAKFYMTLLEMKDFI